MQRDRSLELLLVSLREYPDSGGGWDDIPGQECVKLLQQLGDAGANGVFALLKEATLGPDPKPTIAWRCVFVLMWSRLPLAVPLLTDALDLPLDEYDVREPLFEMAAESALFRADARFVEKAQDLYGRWPNRALREFLHWAEFTCR